jgi:hypothetical protein
VETKADGNQNDRFNLVRSEADREDAEALAKKLQKGRAFVAIALRASDATYAAYFGKLALFPKQVLMKNRSNYKQLAPYTPDNRIKELLTS